MIQILPAGQGQLDLYLTNYVRGFQLPGMVGDILAPRVPVGVQSGKYLDDDSDAQLDINAQLLRAPGTRPAQVALSAPTSESYFCPSRALETPIPDEQQKAYRFGDLSTKAAKYNQTRIMTEREIRVAAIFQNPANYASSNTVALSGPSQLDAPACTPVGLVEEARLVVNLYADPNTLVLAPDVFAAIRVNPDITQRFRGVVPVGGLNEAQLALIFGVEQVIIAKPVQRVGGVRTRIWSNTMLLCYLNPGTKPFGYVDPATGFSDLGPLDASLGKTFVWTDAPGTVDGYGVLTFRDPYLDAKANIVSNDWYGCEKITSPQAGFLFTNCLLNP